MHQDVGLLEDERVVLDEDFGFDLPCDGPRIWPEKIKDHSDPARWIGLKRCGHHRLLCSECKEMYLNLIAHTPAFHCPQCGGGYRTESNFFGFELIDRARH